MEVGQCRGGSVCKPVWLSWVELDECLDIGGSSHMTLWIELAVGGRWKPDWLAAWAPAQWTQESQHCSGPGKPLHRQKIQGREGRLHRPVALYVRGSGA